VLVELTQIAHMQNCNCYHKNQTFISFTEVHNELIGNRDVEVEAV